MPMRVKALLILPYFGSFGPWFPLYLHGLATQHTLDLLLLSDTEPPPLPHNARRVPLTLDELRERASSRLGTPVRLQRIRNVCDLRPAYARVFEEFLDGYGYWAFGDEDVLYGDLDAMLGPHLDGTADLIVPSANGKSGHLTLIKNAARTNELALRDPAYASVMSSCEHWAYDETSWRRGHDVSSFHLVVTKAEARGELFIRRGLPKGTNAPRRGRWYVYDGQRLHDDRGGELLYYHWGRMRRHRIRWPRPEEASLGFAFDRYGFYDARLGGARLLARRAAGRVREMASGARAGLSESRVAWPIRRVRDSARELFR